VDGLPYSPRTPLGTGSFTESDFQRTRGLFIRPRGLQPLGFRHFNLCPATFLQRRNSVAHPWPVL
jgi:hypothetical protein